ncbi:MAG: GntP family permease [Acidobacteriota bacterium]|nr:MAG: GntP family permease [Acidobacteriota bacterium]
MEFLVLGIGVLFIVAAIAGLKMHPFLALVLAGCIVGILSPQPLDLAEHLAVERAKLEGLYEAGAISREEFDSRSAQLKDQTRDRLREQQKPGSQEVAAIELTAREFGSTAASIGIVIVLAAIIGQCLMESGAADKIVRRFLRLLGEKRAPISLMGSGYFLSIPVFFDTVFFLLIPLARALRFRTGKNYILYVMAISGGAVVSHSLVPPTPGPLIMVENLGPMGLSLGTALLLGSLLGVLPAATGLWFARTMNRRLDIPLREAMGSSKEELQSIVNTPDEQLPSFFLSILPVLAPVALIAGNAVLETLVDSQLIAVSESITGWAEFIGNKNFALLIGTFFGLILLLKQKGGSLSALKDRLEPAFLSAGIIILITSAGGAFGKMLSRVGIADALGGLTGSGALSGLVLILLAWGLSSLMKVAQGSGTVAMITASAMVASLLGADFDLPFHPIYLYAAIGFGSLFVSWMNDSAFWVICKMSGFTEKETLKTWTTLMGVLGIAGLVEVVVLSYLLPLN